jgi:hypothetical protein
VPSPDSQAVEVDRRNRLPHQADPNQRVGPTTVKPAGNCAPERRRERPVCETKARANYARRDKLKHVPPNGTMQILWSPQCNQPICGIGGAVMESKSLPLNDGVVTAAAAARKSYVTGPASAVAAMWEQLEFLVAHAGPGCSPECPECLRLEQVKQCLLRPFDYDGSQRS